MVCLFCITSLFSYYSSSAYINLSAMKPSKLIYMTTWERRCLILTYIASSMWHSMLSRLFFCVLIWLLSMSNNNDVKAEKMFDGLLSVKLHWKRKGKTPPASFSFTFLFFSLSICLFTTSICTYTWKFCVHTNIHIFFHNMTKGNCTFFRSFFFKQTSYSLLFTTLR